MAVAVGEVSSRKELDRFLKFPWQIYGNDRDWVPPLLSQIRRELDPDSNPFWKNSDRKLFCAYDTDNRLLGRVVAIHNLVHNRRCNEAQGFFGYFECVDQSEVAQSLTAAARSYLRECGCTRMIGPVNPSTNSESGLLLGGHSGRATFMTNHCPEYYHRLLVACGFVKAMDTYSYRAESTHEFPGKYERVLKRILKNPAIELRAFSRTHSQHDITIIGELYNASFVDTWGFVPMNDEEAQALAESFLPFADLELVWIAYYRGEPAGFILGLPDLNEILPALNGRLFPFGIFALLARRRRISNMRVLAFGVLPKYRSIGIEAALVMKERERIVTRPYRHAEFSVVMENNSRMRSLISAFGFQPYRSYRIYQQPIG